MQRANVVSELHYLNGPDGDYRRTPQLIVETAAQQPAKAVIYHFERWHAAAHDAAVTREIVRAHLVGRGRGFGLHLTAVEAAHERIDFVLAENLHIRHKHQPPMARGTKPVRSALRGVVLHIAARISRQGNRAVLGESP